MRGASLVSCARLRLTPARAPHVSTMGRASHPSRPMPSPPTGANVLTGSSELTAKQVGALTRRRLLNFVIFVQRAQFTIPGGPIKTEQSIQSIFQDFVLINSYLFPLAG